MSGFHVYYSTFPAENYKYYSWLLLYTKDNGYLAGCGGSFNDV